MSYKNYYTLEIVFYFMHKVFSLYLFFLLHLKTFILFTEKLNDHQKNMTFRSNLQECNYTFNLGIQILLCKTVLPSNELTNALLGKTKQIANMSFWYTQTAYASENVNALMVVIRVGL